MNDDNITYLADCTGDSMKWTVDQMLRDAVNEVSSGRRTPTKAIVIYLDDSDNGYHVGFSQSGMRLSEIVALTTVLNHILARDLGDG